MKENARPAINQLFINQNELILIVKKLIQIVEVVLLVYLRKEKTSNRKGCTLSEDQKKLISIAMKKYHSENNHPMLGKKHSVDTIEKMRESNKGEKNGMYGKKHSIETKMKISKANKGNPGPNISNEGLKILRQKRIREIEIDKYSGNQMIPSFNKKSCQFFELLDKKMNWNGIYATKGREYKINNLGYFVDYYEPTKNVVIEWDERDRYNPDGTLKEKYAIRQTEIINELKCKFFRIKEMDFDEDEFIQKMIAEKI